MATWYHTLLLTEVTDCIEADSPEADETTKQNASRPPARTFVKANPSKVLLRVFCLKITYCWPADELPERKESSELKRTQASSVKLAGFSAGESGTCT